MKISIQVDDNCIEEELVIRCAGVTEEILKIQHAVSEITGGPRRFSFYKGETEYYLPLEDVLFFETDEKDINVHTADNVYQTKYKLYELEELLPRTFMRISKSAILNADKVFSLTHSISTNVVEFQHTRKQVYVSRNYYKALKEKIVLRG